MMTAEQQRAGGKIDQHHGSSAASVTPVNTSKSHAGTFAGDRKRRQGGW
jgi:hypothetical protein